MSEAETEIVATINVNDPDEGTLLAQYEVIEYRREGMTIDYAVRLIKIEHAYGATFKRPQGIVADFDSLHSALDCVGRKAKEIQWDAVGAN